MEQPVKQYKKQLPWLKDYQWKPGESGNPNGRPPGKTLKEWARLFLEELPDEQKLAFLKELPPEIVWKMAEGNPHNTGEIEIDVKPQPLLDALRHNHSDQKDISPK